MPRFSAETQAELKKFLPEAGGIFGNPIDSTTLISPKGITTAFQVLGSLPDINLFVFHLGFHPTTRWGGYRLSSGAFLEPIVAALDKARQATNKPVLIALRPPPDLWGTKFFLGAQEAFVGAGFPVFHSLGQAAKAVALVAEWNKGR